MSAHTSGPWEQNGPNLVQKMHATDWLAIQITMPEGASDEAQDANAARIVACVNACEGITNDELAEISRTGGLIGPREDVARIAKQRDELARDSGDKVDEITALKNDRMELAAVLANLIAWESMRHTGIPRETWDMARAALAKVQS